VLANHWITVHSKIAPFGNQSERFSQWWSMGKYLIFCRIQLKFRFWLHKELWHISWKFPLELRSDKKDLTKMTLTNLYEINSSTFEAWNLERHRIWYFVNPSTLSRN